MTDHLDTGGLRLAPGVTLTHLPFGGTVVVDGATLAIAECGERDAARLDLLLSRNRAVDPESGAFADELIEAGWLVAGRHNGEESR